MGLSVDCYTSIFPASNEVIPDDAFSNARIMLNNFFFN